MTPEFKSQLLFYAVVFLGPILLTAIVGLLVWSQKRLHEKFMEDGKLSPVESIILKVIHFAEMSARDVEATVKPSLKAKAADGKLDAKDYADLQKEGLHRLKASLGQRGLEELKSSLGLGSEALDSYLTGALEKAVAGIVTKGSANPQGALPGGLPLPPSPGQP